MELYILHIISGLIDSIFITVPYQVFRKYRNWPLVITLVFVSSFLIFFMDSAFSRIALAVFIIIIPMVIDRKYINPLWTLAPFVSIGLLQLPLYLLIDDFMLFCFVFWLIQAFLITCFYELKDSLKVNLLRITTKVLGLIIVLLLLALSKYYSVR